MAPIQNVILITVLFLFTLGVIIYFPILDSPTGEAVGGIKGPKDKTNTAIISDTINEPSTGGSTTEDTFTLDELSARSDELINLIKNNPEQAFDFPTLAEDEISAFPQSVQDEYVEEVGEFTGDLTVIHMDDFENPENSRIIFYLKTDNKTYELFSNEGMQLNLSGATVRVYGVAIDSVMAIKSNQFNSPNQENLIQKSNLIDNKNIIKFGATSTGSASAVQTMGPFIVVSFPPPTPKSENLGPQSTIVLIRQNPSVPSPLPLSEVDQLIFSNAPNTVQDFYIKNSYEKTSLVGDVVGPYTIDNTSCTWSELVGPTIAAADDDVYFPDYDRVIVLVKSSDCPAGPGGSSTLGKTNLVTNDGTSRVSISLINVGITQPFDESWYVIIHELGHGFGAWHANLFYCYDPKGNIVPYSFQCESSEYGDEHDIMGGVPGKHFNAPHKEEVGWFTSANKIITSEGTYNLKPLELKLPPGEIQQILLPIDIEPNYYVDEDNVFYSIEFRQPIDYDVALDPSAFEGILIHIAKFDDKDFTYFNTNIVDNGVVWRGNDSLKVGKTYTDQINGYAITLDNITTNQAQVTIERIPKIEVKFDKPIVYFNFDKGVGVDDFVEDNAEYIWGAKKAPFTYQFVNDGGLLFDGQTHYLTLGGFANEYILQNDNFTIASWVNVKDFSSNYLTVLQMGKIGLPKLILDNQFPSLQVTVDNGTRFITVKSNEPLPVNEWHHLAATYDGSEFALYVDGIKKASKYDPNKTIFIDFLDNKSLSYIGSGYRNYFFNGILDELKIYARGLNSNEIIDLYNDCPIETDDGRDYYTKGKVVDRKGEEHTDSCLSRLVLREYYCVKGELQVDDHRCGDFIPEICDPGLGACRRI